MAKYTEIQSRKVISSYGGVESIIETPMGALKVEKFNLWPLFKSIRDGTIDKQKLFIHDNRLLKRLQIENGFPKLQDFIEVPINYSDPYNKKKPENLDKTISANYFPTWFYCNNCRGFKNLSGWWKLWKNILQKYNKHATKEMFIPPKCAYCYDKARKKSNGDGRKRKLYYDLEQVRFLMTAPTGEIRDIPWERWNKYEVINSEGENEINQLNRFDFDNLCCDNQDLKYIKSKKFSDLTGIRIKCKNCNTSNTLAGFFSIRLRVPNKDNSFFKPVLRTSNSCYYPVLINSIYLPVRKEIGYEDEQKILTWKSRGLGIDFMWEALERKYDKEAIRSIINGQENNEFESETSYRLKEYKFLTDGESNDENLVFERIENEELAEFGINYISAIRRLKVTTVQIAYTRQEPIENDVFLLAKHDEEESRNVIAQYTSDQGKNTEYLPAIESYGEGIFIALDEDRITQWYLDGENHPRFSKRLEQLFKNSKNNDRKQIRDKFLSKKHLAKFVLVHTLSHVLIKELEFLCGYPSTSLNERLFINEDFMQGLIIYTVAGSEGSYGGLVSQTSDPSLNNLLKSAIYRATDCASDPICYNTQDGQGIGGLNMAACYSCSLIPENACEEFNSFLDRSFLIDHEYGFFRGL